MDQAGASSVQRNVYIIMFLCVLSRTEQANHVRGQHWATGTCNVSRSHSESLLQGYPILVTQSASKKQSASTPCQ